MRLVRCVVVLLGIAICGRVWGAEESSKWEKDIRGFEEKDRTNLPPKGGVLFVGSSSIRLWKTLESDFPKCKVINRGFGGSQIVDSTAFAERIIVPYAPSKIVLYAGDNDVAAGKKADQVLEDFRAFVKKVRGALPEAAIYFIAIKPSPSRAHLLQEQTTANKLVEQFASGEKRIFFVDVAKPMLDSKGEPRGEFFVDDKLHLNAAGYALWRRILNEHLDCD